MSSCKYLVMADINELWFAGRKTEIVFMPRKLIETFGETSVHYTLLSETEDGKVRVRTGLVRSARPRIITPHYFATHALENFGEDARRYFEDLLNRQDGAEILQYGLGFSKEDHAEEVVTGEIREMAERLAREAQDHLTEVRGVLTGPDAHWEVSLIAFLKTLIRTSAPVNAREMAGRGLFARQHGIPAGIHEELEGDFRQVQSREAADRLGKKLREYGLFDLYEDRFFQLYSRFCD